MVNYINTTVIIPVCSHNDSPHVLLVPFPLTKKLCGTISDVFFGELPILSHKASTVRNFHIYLALNIYTCMHTEHLFLLGMLPNTTSSSYSRSFVFKYPSKLVGHFLFMLLQHGNNCVQQSIHCIHISTNLDRLCPRSPNVHHVRFFLAGNIKFKGGNVQRRLVIEFMLSIVKIKNNSYYQVV